MSKSAFLSVIVGVSLSLVTAASADRHRETPTPSVSPTRTATPEPEGCCQVDGTSSTDAPICGNRIKQSDCFASFGNRAHFCLQCDCSSHREPGFTFDRGECVPQTTPTRTATATATPTATATQTPLSRRGCCRINTSRPGPHPYLCGNQIDELSCLKDFGDEALFCADCTCSSHATPGFGTTPGDCLTSSTGNGRPPRPTRVPRPPRPTRRPH